MSNQLTLAALNGVSRKQGESWYNDSQLLIFGSLLSFRILNALSIKTFFQPDEYFQSLEPAWQSAFGPDSGAWITWEWREQLRSAIHPLLFAWTYGFAYSVGSSLGLDASSRAKLLLMAPKLLQASFAAAMDFFTARLALRTYGNGNKAFVAALILTACSPWQWFCSTRTLSNSLETTMTIIALDLWPWAWFFDGNQDDKRDKQPPSNRSAWDTVPAGLEMSLLASALACILRPTNLMIWVTIGLTSLLTRLGHQKTSIVARCAFLCGLAVFGMSYGVDRKYYGEWALPQLKFLEFNLVQSLAVFYGRNRPDYYLTEGLPLLLTTTLPFATIGLWRSLLRKGTATGSLQKNTLFILALTVLVTVAILSLISHKEVRFIYPLLPTLHILAAKPLATFFDPFPWPRSKPRRVLLLLGLIINLIIAAYVTLVHQRGVIDVMHYLRHRHEVQSTHMNTTIGFLMPCHSTPWRSHLIHAGIEAWALTCEPPIGVPMAERESYMDEADVFYENPGNWALDNMQDLAIVYTDSSTVKMPNQGAVWVKRPWPEYLVFFAQLEPQLQDLLAETRYRQSWRGFNTHFHDDWRRQGDVVVWRLE